MPEAAVDEKGLLPPSKDKVRPAWQVARMETIPEAEAVDQVPDEQLWLGVSVTDAAHALAALGLGERIDHAVIADYPAGPAALVGRGPAGAVRVVVGPEHGA